MSVWDRALVMLRLRSPEVDRLADRMLVGLQLHRAVANLLLSREADRDARDAEILELRQRVMHLETLAGLGGEK